MIKEKTSNQSSCQNLHIPFSFKTTCLFVLLFISLVIITVGVPVLCIILILKPQVPDFSLGIVNVESYKLEERSQNLIVSSVLSLKLEAENPNKVGLSFDSSRFHVLSQGLVVGLIRIPQFHQPPSSKNVSIQSRVSFECVNISEIMSRNPRKSDPSDIRILGDVTARVRIFHVNLPKIRVSLDCDINVSQSRLSVSNEAYSMRWNHNHLISLTLNSQTVSKKCSLAVLV